MKAANGKLAQRRAWLGVAALGMLACSLALAGAPVRRPSPSASKGTDRQSLSTLTAVQHSGSKPVASVEEGGSIRRPEAANDASGNAAGAQSLVTSGSGSSTPDVSAVTQRVVAGQMPKGEFPLVASVVVDYRDDDMTRARARGELVGPLPLPAQLGGVASGGGCSFNIQCDDANRCTVDTCNFPAGGTAGSGKCEHDPVPDGFNSVVGGGISETCVGIGTCSCDDDNFCNGFETCQDALCAAGSARNEGLTCDSHSDCQTAGVCNTNTGLCSSGATGEDCLIDDDCAVPGTGTCNPGVCTPGLTATCCADRDGCMPEFATCSEDSANKGEPCQVDSDCRAGAAGQTKPNCSRCQPLCKDDAACDDEKSCNGVESCTAKICYGGTANGNSCTDDGGCPPDGKCLGTCVHGVNPCGGDADCAEKQCFGGGNANVACESAVDCPGGECVGTRCNSGPNNAKACKLNSDCPPGLAGACTAGAICFQGRCCASDLIGDPSNYACEKLRLANCTGNWYSGDGGRELVVPNAPGCGGSPADRSEDYECPKYASGMTQTSAANPPQRLVTAGPISDSSVCVPGPGGPGNNGTGGNCVADPDGPAGRLNKLGDDYTLSNNSHIGLDVFRWVGGTLTDADRILIEFYDNESPPNLIEDIVMPPQTTTTVGVIVVQFRPALTIPPNGYVVARVASNFSPNTQFVWKSTNAAAVGTNDAGKLWVNGGPASNFLSPNPGVLAFELVGDKIAPPSGACCETENGACEDVVAPWVCEGREDIYNGNDSKCASCNAGMNTAGFCRTCSGNGTTPCNDNADCTGPGGTCTPDNDLCPPLLKCVGGSNPGALCPGGAGCTGGTCTGNICSNAINTPCLTTANCPGGVGVTCGPPQCRPLASCASGACCNPSTGACTTTMGPGPCDGVCSASVAGSTCVGGVGAGQTCSTNADCEFFQGFGTSCDADNGLDGPQQHCCPQPPLGFKCMGGPVVEGTCDPQTLRCTTGDVGATCTVGTQDSDCDLTGNNLQACTMDSECRECSGGPMNGDACSVHADCARCRGGDNDGLACVDDDDCPGSPDGVCAGHCLGVCVNRSSGADNCADAEPHIITVPLAGADPVTVTITGNNNGATSSVENPESCLVLPFGHSSGVGSEPGWWEAFEINDCAWVRIDFCCTKPVHEPAWAFITTDCACDNTLGNTPPPQHFGELANFRGPPYCDEDNLWQWFGPLAAGRYYYPVYSVLAGHHGDYQVHITVEACPESACCLPNGACVDSVNQADCDNQNGFSLQRPQVGSPVGTCIATAPGASGNPCNTGSCCTAPGTCKDQVSESDQTVMTKLLCDTAGPGGTPGSYIGGVRCAGAECLGGADDGESCRLSTDCASPGTCQGSASEFAQKNPCPICEHFGASTCHLEAGRFVWLSDASAVANPTRQCDDIMPSETGTLSEICVLGHYIGFPNGVRTDNCEDTDGGVADSFSVRLYAPDPTRYFPGAVLGEWATTHVPNPRGEFRTVTTWGPNNKFYDFQLTLIPNDDYPLYELEAGEIYFLEIANNSTGGMPECNFYMLDSAPGQGNNYAFLDGCGTTYTEDSVKLFVTDPDAMSDPSWCLNVAFDPPPTPVRACCTGDPLNPCVDSPIRECAEIAGDWQFGQMTCSGYVCPVEDNDLCARAPLVHEGVFEFNMFGATRDGDEIETCADNPTQDFAGDIWFFYKPTVSRQAYIGTCDCERGADEVVAVYTTDPPSPTCWCPGDPGKKLLQCYDGPQANYIHGTLGCQFGAAGEVVLQAADVNPNNCYTIRVATDGGTTPARANLRIALAPAICGDNIRQEGVPSGESPSGEQCDGTDSALCPGKCSYNCQCPLTVCGNQCVGGAFDGQPCDTLLDCPQGGTACQGKVEPLLGEECDTTAAGGSATCTGANTSCRGPGELGACVGGGNAGAPCENDGECLSGNCDESVRPCSCIPVCGNNRREGGEVCDGSDDDACGTAGCNPVTCRCNATCGDGQVSGGEQCDPGGISGAPPNDSLCKTRCINLPGNDPADCTCPPASCGNDYTELFANNEECDGLDLAVEAQCPPEECRPPGDPAGECTCACAGGVPPPQITWRPTKSCDAGTNINQPCTTDAGCPPGTPVGVCKTYPNNNTDATTRSLNFTVAAAVTAADSPVTSAIKVTMMDLAHPRPANAPASVTRRCSASLDLCIGTGQGNCPAGQTCNLYNFSAYDTKNNGVCVGGSHPGHHCDVDADCRVCISGSTTVLHHPCTSNADCGGGAGSCPAGGTCSSLTMCSAAGEAVPADASGQGGCARWVGEPHTFLESQDLPLIGNYRAARLQCTPFYYDWSTETATFGPITLNGAEILPSSTYSLQAYSASCKGEEEGCDTVSAPVEMRTRRYGDVVSSFNPPTLNSQEPAGSDVTQLVNKFRNQPLAPPKAISLIQPNMPELNGDVSGSDITRCVDAFRQVEYRFLGPCPCPSLAVCGALACPSSATVCTTNAGGLPGLGRDATCVRTCTGGDNNGDPCVNNSHCPGGGTCGNPFCRDRCGRCKP